MKYLGVLLLVLVSQEFCMAITVPNEVTRVDRFQHPSYNGVSMKPVFPFRRQDDDNSSSSNISISNDDSSSSDGKSQDLQIPTINFYSTIPNAIGVVGQGFLWIREVSAAIGTPVAIYVMTPPMLLLGVGLIFMPDLTGLGLPLFYPGGGDETESLTFGDLENLDFLKQAGELLPPGILSKRG